MLLISETTIDGDKIDFIDDSTTVILVQNNYPT